MLIPIDELLKESWELYKKCWKPLLVISLITIIAGKIWTMLVVPALLVFFGISALATGSPYGIFGIGLVGIGVLLLTWIVIFEISFWGTTASLLSLVLFSGGKIAGIKEIYMQAKKFLWPLSVVSLYMFFTIALGFVFLVIPGMVLIFLLQYTNFVAVSENKTGFAALQRSVNIVFHNLFGVLGRNLIIIFIIYFINMIFKRMLFFNLVSHIIILPFILTYHYLLYKSASSLTK